MVNAIPSMNEYTIHTAIYFNSLNNFGSVVWIYSKSDFPPINTAFVSKSPLRNYFMKPHPFDWLFVWMRRERKRDRELMELLDGRMDLVATTEATFYL